MLTKTSHQPCKDITIIEECYIGQAEECFTEENSLKMSAAAVVTALEDGEDMLDCNQEPAGDEGCSLFPWL